MLSRKSYKVVLLGNPFVGKTSIRRRYMGKNFNSDYNVTLGADFAIKRLQDIGILQIWDLAGQPIYKSVRSGYYKGAQGAILIFDVTRPETYKQIPKWIDEMVSIIGQPIPLILVGNKTDLREDSDASVSSKNAEKYATKLSEWSSYNIPYIESSAMSGKNINKIFEILIEEIEIFQTTQQGN